VLKNKNDQETTASRKPLFHEKPNQTRYHPNLKIKQKQTRSVNERVLIFAKYPPKNRILLGSNPTEQISSVHNKCMQKRIRQLAFSTSNYYATVGQKNDRNIESPNPDPN
jgi:hypothetical protein